MTAPIRLMRWSVAYLYDSGPDLVDRNCVSIFGVRDVLPGRRLVGSVLGHPMIADGETITTARITNVNVTVDGMLVSTVAGHHYLVTLESFDQEAEARYQERFADL